MSSCFSHRIAPPSIENPTPITFPLHMRLFPRKLLLPRIVFHSVFADNRMPAIAIYMPLSAPISDIQMLLGSALAVLAPGRIVPAAVDFWRLPSAPDAVLELGWAGLAEGFQGVVVFGSEFAFVLGILCVVWFGGVWQGVIGRVGDVRAHDGGERERDRERQKVGLAMDWMVRVGVEVQGSWGLFKADVAWFMEGDESEVSFVFSGLLHHCMKPADRCTLTGQSEEGDNAHGSEWRNHGRGNLAYLNGLI